jgi:hypothetical protein
MADQNVNTLLDLTPPGMSEDEAAGKARADVKLNTPESALADDPSLLVKPEQKVSVDALPEGAQKDERFQVRSGGGSLSEEQTRATARAALAEAGTQNTDLPGQSTLSELGIEAGGPMGRRGRGGPGDKAEASDSASGTSTDVLTVLADSIVPPQAASVIESVIENRESRVETPIEESAVAVEEESVTPPVNLDPVEDSEEEPDTENDPVNETDPEDDDTTPPIEDDGGNDVVIDPEVPPVEASGGQNPGNNNDVGNSRFDGQTGASDREVTTNSGAQVGDDVESGGPQPGQGAGAPETTAETPAITPVSEEAQDPVTARIFEFTRGDYESGHSINLGKINAGDTFDLGKIFRGGLDQDWSDNLFLAQNNGLYELWIDVDGATDTIQQGRNFTEINTSPWTKLVMFEIDGGLEVGINPQDAVINFASDLSGLDSLNVGDQLPS